MAGGTGDGPETNNRSGRTAGAVHFEETVALSDSDYAGLSSLAAAVLLVSLAATVLFIPLALAGFLLMVAVVSGNSVADVATTVGANLPLGAVLGFVLFGLLLGGTVLIAVVTVVRRGSLAYRDEIHTRVTDSGVEVDRDGGYLGQSSGVAIPFEAVTTVEYSDPEGDLKMNIEDIRAEKFIGGRSGDWVRIGRGDSPAVYVGSDRPRMLADVVADRAPSVDSARPFS